MLKKEKMKIEQVEHKLHSCEEVKFEIPDLLQFQEGNNIQDLHRG